MKYKKINEAIRELALVSTAYGIPNLFRSEHLFSKSLWFTFLISSTCACGYFVFYTLVGYLNFEVVTVVKTVYKQPAVFPSVTICSYTNKTYFNSGRSINETIKDCCFSYDYSCQNKSENYFQVVNTQLYGSCLRFNSGRNFTNHSVYLLNSTIGGLDDSFSFQMSMSQDLAIWIHDKDSPPKLVEYNINEGRILVSANSYTQLTIDKIHEFQLDSPYNLCYLNVSEFPLNKKIIDYIQQSSDGDESYSQEKCLSLCFDIHYLNSNPCNCTNTSLGSVWEDCWIRMEEKKFSSCTWEYKRKFYEKNLTENCAKYCPLECESHSYALEISSLQNPGKTRIKMFYRSLKFTQVRQEPKMQLIDLVSNIGGTFGLFIGISFVSLFEITEILVHCFFITFGRKF